jgi:hypothetical protein
MEGASSKHPLDTGDGVSEPFERSRKPDHVADAGIEAPVTDNVVRLRIIDAPDMTDSLVVFFCCIERRNKRLRGFDVRLELICHDR